MTVEKKKQDVKQEAAEEKVEKASTESPEVSGSSSTPGVNIDDNEQQSSTNESEQSEQEKKTVPLHEYVEERKRRRALESRLDALEERLEKSSKPDPVKQLMDDLSVDEETARNLHKHGLGRETNQKNSEMDSLKNGFIREAGDLKSEFNDWDSYINDMERIFASEAQISEAGALRKGPEYYYLKAKLLRSQNPDNSRSEAINKANSKNLAVTESAKNSSSKPKPNKSGWTRERLKGLSHAEYLKHEAEIKAALARGDLN